MSWSIIMVETTKKDVESAWNRYEKKDGEKNESKRIHSRMLQQIW